MSISPSDISEAAGRIEPHVKRTASERSEPLSERYGAEIFIKAEHQQLTGSFKVRGSSNKVHALDADAASRGVVTASSGNHGIGVATAAASRGIPARIFLPSNVSPAKLAQIERLGGTPVLTDSTDAIVGERAARAMSIDESIPYISPYNDPLVAAGQGTIGKEILEDVAGPVDAVVVAVGGGGMISGIATWIKEHSPTTQIIGASALNDRAMAASIEAGKVVTPEFLPTFSDGTAGAIEEDSFTFALCQQLVDVWVDISEADIATAVTEMIDDHHELVEGSAGVAIAAATQHAKQNHGARIVAVSCGGNISSATVGKILALATSTTPGETP